MTRKTCRICKEEKELEKFQINRTYKDGRDGRCAECKNRLQRERRSMESEKEKIRAYCSTDKYKKRRKERKLENGGYFKIVQKRLEQVENRERAGRKFISKEEAIEFGLPRYFDGSICKRGHMAERSLANANCCQCAIEKSRTKSAKKRKAEYYQENKERLVEASVKLQRKMYKESPKAKAAVAIRNMLKRVLYKGERRKHGGSYEMMGFSHDDLIRDMESKFKEGMSWSNYGKWHIDHIVPVSWFINNGITDPAVVNALSNLQPLWAEENLSKGNSVDYLN
jgi:hypothetical protein